MTLPPAVFETESGNVIRVNVAVGNRLLEGTVTVHVPVPEQPPPDHPVKVEPDEGVAVSVTIVPGSYNSLQSVPQLIPEGSLVTVPEPVPGFETDKNPTTIFMDRAVSNQRGVPPGELLHSVIVLSVNNR